MAILNSLIKYFFNIKTNENYLRKSRKNKKNWWKNLQIQLKTSKKITKNNSNFI